jgi:hypothetical protein
VRALRRVSDPPTFPNRRGVRLCAEIRAGELLAEMSKAKPCGSNQHEEGSRGATDPPTLAEVGVTKSQSSRWQQKAALPPGVTNSSAQICGPRYLARHGMGMARGRRHADIRHTACTYRHRGRRRAELGSQPRRSDCWWVTRGAHHVCGVEMAPSMTGAITRRSRSTSSVIETHTECPIPRSNGNAEGRGKAKARFLAGPLATR